MDKEKIIKPSGTLRKTFWDLVDKFLYQFRKGLLTECLEEKALKGFWLQVPWCCATLPPCFSFLHHLLLQTTRLDFNQSLKAPGPTSHSFWTTNT
ncbi:hypothetical protein NC651_014774 [Populus alba x Populus x berolinensis]|nr:hypothetical protein NC651_014774 [Populus alba x Populus x berolinensis]